MKEHVHRAPKNEPFTMPRPKGPFVRWYPHGDTRLEPCFAVPQSDDPLCLDLAVLRTGDRMFTPQFACRHVKDPNVTIEDRQDAGGWENMPDTAEESGTAKIVQAMAGMVTELTKRVADLEKGGARGAKRAGKPRTEE